jgi:WD40 repeat protein
LLAAAGDDGIVRLPRVGQPEVVRELKGHDGWVLSLAFEVPTEEYGTHQLRLWEVTSGERMQALDVKDGGITGLSFSSDGELLAYCSQTQLALL